MLRFFVSLCFMVALANGALAAEGEAASSPPPAPKKKATVLVIPIREEIAAPVLYILRRGLKQDVDAVVLDMNTPGGNLGTTFEILEALENFHGETITYVNKDAISAGAFISAVTKEIYFAPNGVIGAAAPVSSNGQDVDKTMKQKIVSYLKAKLRAITEGKGAYRGQVISAMVDENYELKIGDKVLKEKGELLSLTATEASETYGDPPQPLLAAGIAKDVDELLAKKFGAQGYELRRLEITWSEKLAQYLTAISPVLMGLGLLALFIEFKTPGFGIFGITGIALLAVVFLGNYAAGLSGHEPMVIFGLGLILLVVEVFFFPGVMVMALGGLLLMFGALVWSMADIWPNQPFTLSGDLFLRPLEDVGLAVGLAVVLAVILVRFLPRSLVWDRLVLVAPTGPQVSAPELESVSTLVGQRGIAATALMPSGQVQVGGSRYEARVEVGSIEQGAEVVVLRRTGFSVVVERADL